MKNTAKISIIMVLLYSALFATARQNQIAPPVFSGTFHYKAKPVPDSICILRFTKKWYYNGRTSFTVKVDSQGKFHFKLPRITEPIMIQIAPYEHGKIDGSMEYYVEPGDDISLEITDHLGRSSAVFAGKNSGKYNLAEKLRLHLDEFRKSRQTENSNYDSAHLEPTLTHFYGQLKKAATEKSALIAAAGKTVSPSMKKLIDFEYADYFNVWSELLNSLYTRQYQGNEKVRDLIRNIYYSNGNELMASPDDLSIFCPRYIISLTGKIKMELHFASKTNDLSLLDYYKELCNSYSGGLRERMIAEFIMSPFALEYISNYDPAVYDSLVNDGSQYIRTADIKRVIDDHLRLKKGVKIYPAQFKDLEDKSFNISSLKGKVVLLDIWGEGCGGCAWFHEKFEKDVYPLFKANPSFAVLSISLDRTKEKWLRGIEGGLLTSKDYINVHTAGLSVNHPFLKYYNITAMPFLMLIDKQGLIYSKFDSNLNSNELVKMIRDLLANQI